jgi:anti-sigma-K factor RskA
MTRSRLTAPVAPEHKAAMKHVSGGRLHGQGRRNGWRAARAAALGASVAGLLAGLGGCVSLAAPDKPIVIELNINIKHDVLVQLTGDARQTVQDHKDIF